MRLSVLSRWATAGVFFSHAAVMRATTTTKKRCRRILRDTDCTAKSDPRIASEPLGAAFHRTNLGRPYVADPSSPRAMGAHGVVHGTFTCLRIQIMRPGQVFDPVVLGKVPFIFMIILFV